MIIKPIIPIWIMLPIAAGLIILILFHKPIKKNVWQILTKIGIVLLLFLINLRFMIPDQRSIAPDANVNVLFVIDESVSMRALDYKGKKERLEGVKSDCEYIVNELGTCKFSIVTFGSDVKRIMPFTSDISMVKAELNTITTENDMYAKGSSINIVKETLETLFKKEKEKQKKDAQFVMFFITDGEITMEGERLESFASISQYLDNGAVLGYGTTEGGKMVSDLYADRPTSPNYYKSYIDENSDKKTAISKIDEQNLQQLAKDFKLDYIHMDKQANLKYKITEIKQSITQSFGEKEIMDYRDIYFYFAIPLEILLIIDLILKKRRM